MIRRYVLDASTRQLGDDGRIVLGGSPLRLFRLTRAGAAAFASCRAGDPVAPSALIERLLDAGAIHPIVDGDVPHRFAPGDVTVVVPALNPGSDRLAAIIRSSAGAAAVIVVDDASAPPIGEMPGAQVLRLERNQGPAAARTAGLDAVRTELVAFVDTDVEAEGGWLTGLLGHFDDPRVALVAPRVASGAAEPGASASVAAYEHRHSPLDLGGAPGRVAPSTRIAYVPAAAVVARVAAVTAVGGFDPALRAGEDVDLVWRLVRSGWRVRYEPSVSVLHTPRRSWRALARQRAVYGASAAPLARRHRGAVAPVRTSPWTLGVWALVVAGQPLAALGLAAATAGALVHKLRGVPPGDSLRLAATGHAYAGLTLADAVRRCWLPVALVAACRSRRVRVVMLAAVVPALVDGGGPRLLDDAAYAAGVWRGMVRWRTLRPLLPELVSWPGRRPFTAASADAGAAGTFAP